LRNRKPLVIVLSLFALSGILLTVIQAPICWSFLAWVALVPFALACGPQIKPRTLAWLALGVGYLYWLGNVYWIVPITKIGWLAMGLYLAVFWVLPALAVRFARAKGFPLFIALPILVAGWERLQGFPMGGFYWRFLGHSQYQNLALIQIADFLGAAGVSFVVAMVNGLIADLALRLRIRKERPLQSAIRNPQSAIGWAVMSGAVLTVLAVASTVLYGQWRLRQAQQCVTEGPLVASLQSNVPISVKRSFEASEDIFEELMAKSEAAVAAGANLIVWPETMVQGNLQPELWSNPQVSHWDWNQDKAFHRALGEHAKDHAYVLVGAYGGEILRDISGNDYLGKYNSAYLYRPDLSSQGLEPELLPRTRHPLYDLRDGRTPRRTDDRGRRTEGRGRNAVLESAIRNPQSAIREHRSLPLRRHYLLRGHDSLCRAEFRLGPAGP
jgi:apolipoprotein N-acyltransferase